MILIIAKSAIVKSVKWPSLSASTERIIATVWDDVFPSENIPPEMPFRDFGQTMRRMVSK